MAEEKGGFGWDDEVDPTAEGKKRNLLPEGLAQFIVTKLERKRMDYGKFGPSNVAVLHMMVSSLVEPSLEPEECREQLCLHADLQWKITEFFTAIGQRKHGDKGKFIPDWSKVEDAEGNCEIKHAELTKKDGTKYKVNNIAKFVVESEPHF